MRSVSPLALVVAALVTAPVLARAEPTPMDPSGLGLTLPEGITIDSANRIAPETVTLDLRLGAKPFHVVLRSIAAGQEPLGGSWQAVFGSAARVDITCRACGPEELVVLKEVGGTIAEQGAPLVSRQPRVPAAVARSTRDERPIRDHRLPIPLAVIVALAVLWALVHLLWRLVRGLVEPARAVTFTVAALAVATHLVALASSRMANDPIVAVFASASLVVAVLSSSAVLGVRAAAVVAIALLAHPFARDARLGLHASLALALVPAAVTALWQALRSQRRSDRVAAGLLVGALPWGASELWPVAVALLVAVLVDPRRGPVRAWSGPLVLALAAGVPPALLSLRTATPPQEWAVALAALVQPLDSIAAGSALLAAWLLVPLFAGRDDADTEPFRFAVVLSAVVAIAACVAWSAGALVGAVVPLALSLGVVASLPGAAGVVGTAVALVLALLPLVARFGGG